jgi:hypothetical protein
MSVEVGGVAGWAPIASVEVEGVAPKSGTCIES